ncbi:MAG: protein kinase domain-containing protein, partial [Planctomycetota bacterium]
LECIEGHRFFSLEFIEGITLKEALRIRKYGNPDLLELFKQVAEALHFAHKAGIAHCDLKPANVMIDGRGSAKILDFGIARAMRSAPTEEKGDHVSGTPGYMSPEQIKGQTPDQQADVWAFGCMLFEALAGEPAFPGEDADAVIHATLNKEPNWQALPKNLPASLKEILRGCLQKETKARSLCLQQAAETLHDVAHSLSWQQEDVLVSKALSSAKKAGEKAPKFELRGSDSRSVCLGKELAQGPLILTFYRGSWCSICTSELQGFEHLLDEIRKLGGNVLGISPQGVTHNRDLLRRERLSFDLLSDPGNIVASKYGIAVELPTELRRYHSSLGLDLAQFNGDNSWVLPMPATFLVDRGRVVRYAAVTGDPTLRPDPRECVEVLRGFAK